MGRQPHQGPPAAGGDGLPYWRLSSFYLFYFATLGALLPYWGLYLQDHGYSAAEIGELMAILAATKVVAPNVWGWMADHTGRRMAVVRSASLLAVVAFAGVFTGSGYWWMAAVMITFSFFWNAALPQFEANTLTFLGDRAHRYTHIRVWGSVGFIAASMGLGPLLDRTGVDVLPWVVLGLMAAIWGATLLVEDRHQEAHADGGRSLGSVLRNPAVIALLVSCFLIQGSHGPYYSFYSIRLEDLGYSRTVIGALWALGVLAEVVLFLFTHRLILRYGLRPLFLLTFALTTLRWVLIALFATEVPVLVFAQVLHAASFGLYHAVGIQLIHRYFVGRHQGRGQALYSSVSFGAGGAMGSFLAGRAWEGLGPEATFLGSAAATFVGLLVVWRWVGTDRLQARL